VAKALHAGRTSLRAVRFGELPDPDYHNVSPEELAYD